MIPENKKSTMISNCNAGSEFQIEANQFMFELLSSGLYKRKEEAVVRELCCNARDSHTVAGNSEPFHVVMPTIFEPTLTIKDFGTGLSKEDVMSIYRVYGASNKRGSNETIGGLGVGSKSPLCCSSSFTVESIHDGVFTQYMVYTDEQLRPCITETYSEETDEHNGVTIKVPVKVEDIGKFQQAVSRVWSWIDMKPEVFNLGELNLIDKTFEGDYTITSSGYEIRVLMGGVIYDCYFPEFLNNPLYIQGAVIKFDIGDLSFTASRESISSTDLTKKKVMDKVTKITEKLSVEIQKEIDKVEYISDLYDSNVFKFSNKLLKLYKDQLTWKGVTLADLDLKVNMLTGNSTTLKEVSLDFNRLSVDGVKVMLLDYPKYKRYVSKKIKWRGGFITEDLLPNLQKECEEVGLKLDIRSLKHYVEVDGIRPPKRLSSGRDREVGHDVRITEGGRQTQLKGIYMTDLVKKIKNFKGKVVYYTGYGSQITQLSNVFPDVMFVGVTPKAASMKTFVNLGIKDIKTFTETPSSQKKITKTFVDSAICSLFSDTKKFFDAGLSKEITECFSDKKLANTVKRHYSKKDLASNDSILLSHYFKDDKGVYTNLINQCRDFERKFSETYPLASNMSFNDDSLIYIKAKYKLLKKQGEV